MCHDVSRCVTFFSRYIENVAMKTVTGPALWRLFFVLFQGEAVTAHPEPSGRKPMIVNPLVTMIFGSF